MLVFVVGFSCFINKMCQMGCSVLCKNMLAMQQETINKENIEVLIYSLVKTIQVMTMLENLSHVKGLFSMSEAF